MVLYLKKFLNIKCTMINPTKQENLKVESSIETEKKEIKIPKIKNEKIGCNNSEFKGSNNPELIKS
ncbi:hypothetical protein ACMBCN_01045 [Candidatus Liberibacter asiaticus]|nr:hypothetical protein [Candidatus Liberibacter asiaticus]